VVVVTANFDSAAQKITIPFPAQGEWKELFSDKVVTVQGEFQADLEPWSAQIFFRP
jgi:hypothetical protein